MKKAQSVCHEHSKDFDDLLGLTNVFTRSHEIFNKFGFYLADGTNFPKWNRDGNMIPSECC